MTMCLFQLWLTEISPYLCYFIGIKLKIKITKIEKHFGRLLLPIVKKLKNVMNTKSAVLVNCLA